MLCCFSVKLLVVYFFWMHYSGCCFFRLWFSFFFSFLLLFVCFFSCFFLRFSKSAAPQFFMVVFHNFSAVFCGEGIFMATFFAVFFFHSLWRFDDFYCLYLIWHSMGSAQCVIYVRHQISESTICTVVGTFLILKAINYFLCFCFVFIR